MKIRMHRIKSGSKSVASFEVPEEAVNWYVKLVKKGNALGDVYDVSIELPKRHRSTGPKSQNHHGNAHCMQIAAETGNSFEVVKMETKKMAAEHGNWQYETLPNGHIWPGSEACATVGEAIEWIECCHQLASELGIKLMEGEE